MNTVPVPKPAEDKAARTMQGHAHHHDHVHDHDHVHVQVHGHAHAHDHAAHVATLEPARAARPGFSLLRLSALERLAGAGVALALMWIAVLWALN